MKIVAFLVMALFDAFAIGLNIASDRAWMVPINALGMICCAAVVLIEATEHQQPNQRKMTMTAFPNVKRPGGDYWKPANIGDQITGILSRVGETANYDNTGMIPEIVVTTDEGSDVIVQGSQVDLMVKLYDLGEQDRLNVGDRIRITFSSTVPTKKGSPKKVFSIDIKAGEPVKAEDVF